MTTHITSHPEFARPTAPAGPPGARPGAGARVWAGAVVVAGGLGLIVLGGCFLYGVLLLVSHGNLNTVLEVVLYVLAFWCFATAAALLAVGFWGLTRILLGKPIPPEADG